MTTLHRKRFAELEDQLSSVEASRHFEMNALQMRREYVDDQLLLNWTVKARNLIERSCGKDSQHFESFVAAEEPASYVTNVHTLTRVKAVFLAAKEDFEGGYVRSIRNLIQAEVFESELEQAATLLSSGYALPAAVVAGVVLETALRTVCVVHGIAVGSMDRMNADLTKAGVYNSLVQKRITALAAIRNSASHGKASEFTTEDVRAMLPEVDRLLVQLLP